MAGINGVNLETLTHQLCEGGLGYADAVDEAQKILAAQGKKVSAGVTAGNILQPKNDMFTSTTKMQTEADFLKGWDLKTKAGRKDAAEWLATARKEGWVSGKGKIAKGSKEASVVAMANAQAKAAEKVAKAAETATAKAADAAAKQARVLNGTEGSAFKKATNLATDKVKKLPKTKKGSFTVATKKELLKGTMTREAVGKAVNEAPAAGRAARETARLAKEETRLAAVKQHVAALKQRVNNMLHQGQSTTGSIGETIANTGKGFWNAVKKHPVAASVTAAAVVIGGLMVAKNNSNKETKEAA